MQLFKLLGMDLANYHLEIPVISITWFSLVHMLADFLKELSYIYDIPFSLIKITMILSHFISIWELLQTNPIYGTYLSLPSTDISLVIALVKKRSLKSQLLLSHI